MGDSTRERLLRAAGPIFASKGFRDATVREICDRAEVNLASVNYHFGDKERLYVEVLKYAHSQRMNLAASRSRQPSSSPVEDLRRFVHDFVFRALAMEDDSWESQILLREFLKPSTACRELVQENIRPHFEALMRILSRLLPEDVPPEKRHKIGFSIIGQCVYYRVGHMVVEVLISPEEKATHFSAEQVADHIVQFSLAAIAGAAHVETFESISG